MKGAHRGWIEAEQLVALRLYCRIPFGKLHDTNPEIKAVAAMIGRTPAAVSMKACNFASLDPEHQQRGVAGLSNRSKADEELWQRFESDPEAVAADIEQAWSALMHEEPAAEATPDEAEIVIPIETEREQVVRVRRVQRFFRETVLVSYENRCALSGLAVPELLNASHIVPWSRDVKRRADPRNGLCLNALYDRAFNRGLIGFDDRLRVVVSPALQAVDAPPLHRDALIALGGCELRSPVRFRPDAQALAWHRANIFREVG